MEYSHLPVVTIVGRPNVGKTTLFNQIVKFAGKPRAITSHVPGTTRDLNEGLAHWKERDFIVIDTAGEPTRAHEELAPELQRAIDEGIQKADLVVLVVDHAVGLTAQDKQVTGRVRQSRKPWIVVANKADAITRQSSARIALAPYYALGETVVAATATSRRGVQQVLNAIRLLLPPDMPTDAVHSGAEIAIVGRPNVGKSTLLNALVGTKRAIVSPISGTTRDPVEARFAFGDSYITLVDTAGIRRRGSIEVGVEKESVRRAIARATHADLVIVVLDAKEGPTRSDAHAAEMARRAKIPFIVVYTKMDQAESELRDPLHLNAIQGRFPFLARAKTFVVSGVTGENINLLKKELEKSIPHTK